MSVPNPTNPVNGPRPTLQDSHQSLEKSRGNFNYKDYYRWMNEQLTPRISSLAVALLGNPSCRRPTEWRWGRKGGVVVYVAGEKIGRFSDFEAGVSGDALELVKFITGYRGKELHEWVKSFVGYQPYTFKNQATFRNQEEPIWVPIIPVPEEALRGDILQGLSGSFARKGMSERGRYCYRDLGGNILGYVVRFEDALSKVTLPLTYCTNGRGTKGWRWKGFPVPRPPYGAELLKGSTNTVLIVEGEKKCHTARTIFPGKTVISWVAGTGSVHLTEWSCLAGRDVILWPDHDEPGVKCMAKLKAILGAVGAASVSVVRLPPYMPRKWDLADDLPEGWDRATLDNLINEALLRNECLKRQMKGL